MFRNTIIALSLLCLFFVGTIASKSKPIPERAEVAPQQQIRIDPEPMIGRLTDRIASLKPACRLFPPTVCTNSILGLELEIPTMRRIAASGDAVKWAQVIQLVYKFEADSDEALRWYRSYSR